MRPLDWRSVLTENGISYVDKGPNVKRGELNIRCPFCGSADPSHHMGLNLESGFWACWRNSEHRGKSPLRLLCQLLNIGYASARKIAGLDFEYVDPDGYTAMVATLMRRNQVDKVEHVKQQFLQFPPEFKDLHEAPPRFYDYLRRVRDFGSTGTRDLAELYGIMYCSRGTFRDRVILPYRDHDGRLVAYTGRAIAPATVRYRDLDRDECLTPIKDTLFNLDGAAQGGGALVVVEGPIDALKIDVFGRDIDIRAVALSTNSVSEAQIYLLEDLASTYAKVYVMLDAASELGIVDSMRMRSHLRSIPNASIIPVPFGLKDAGEMTPRQAMQFVDNLSTQ